MAEIEYKPDNRFVCIDYPGKVKNVDKMLETLGGIDSLTKVYNESGKRLELKYRPNNPSAFGTRGDQVKSCSMLLKIKRKKKSIGSASSSDSELKAEILGVVPTTYKFKALMEFQYLPMQKEDNGRHKSIISELAPNNILTEISWLERPCPIFVLPPMFSRYDLPQNYYFRRPPKPKSGPQLVIPANIISKTRKNRSRPFQTMNFDDTKVPSIPNPDVLKTLNTPAYKDLHEQLKKIFEERPIWSRNALIVKLKCERHKMKRLLSGVAYYMFGGPWRGLWVRFSYDPKVDRNAKMYQLVDFRVKANYGTRYLNTSLKRISLENTLPNVKSKPSKSYSLELPNAESEAQDYVFETPYGKKFPGLQRDLVYKFISGKFPPFRQMFYQMCDLELESIKNLVEEDELEEQRVCHPKFGWFSEDILAKSRIEINKDIMNTLESEKCPTSKVDVTLEDEAVPDQDLEDEDEAMEYFDEPFDNEMESELLDFME